MDTSRSGGRCWTFDKFFRRAELSYLSNGFDLLSWSLSLSGNSIMHHCAVIIFFPGSTHFAYLSAIPYFSCHSLRLCSCFRPTLELLLLAAANHLELRILCCTPETSQYTSRSICEREWFHCTGTNFSMCRPKRVFWIQTEQQSMLAMIQDYGHSYFHDLPESGSMAALPKLFELAAINTHCLLAVLNKP